MFAAPYLVLFFISLTLQIVAVKKEDDGYAKWGYISGALCGLYIVFMIWVVAGFGESTSSSYIVTVNGRPLYGGVSTIFPLVVCALMLTPLLSYLPKWLAALLTNFIFTKPNFTHTAPGIKKNSDPNNTFTAILLKIIACFAYLLIGVLPLIFLSDELRYYDSFTGYVSGSFTNFAFCGLLLALWLLIPVKLFVTLVMYLLHKFLHRNHSK